MYIIVKLCRESTTRKVERICKKKDTTRSASGVTVRE